MRAKLIFLHVYAADPARSSNFYDALFGTNMFSQSLTDKGHQYHMPISSDGIDFNISQPFAGSTPRIIPFFAVDDVTAAIGSLTAAGGKKVADYAVDVPDSMFEQFRTKAAHNRPPHGEPITNRLGQATLMLDPDNNPIGLMQLEPFVHQHFKSGAYSQPLSQAQLEDHVNAVQVARDVFFVRK